MWRAQARFEGANTLQRSAILANTLRQSTAALQREARKSNARVAPMRLTRTDCRLLAWMLYFSVLFSAFACSIGHGQMAGLQLSGLSSQYCSFDGNFGAGADLDGSGIVAPNSATGSGCSLSSTFSAIILAAFFGLLGLLAPSRAPRLSLFFTPRSVRYLWPSANPRASPLIP